MVVAPHTSFHTGIRGKTGVGAKTANTYVRCRSVSISRFSTAVSGSQSHSYVYDKVHNRTGADGVTYTSNNLHQYTSVAGITYAHDSNGNLTSDGITTYTYDEENRLTTAVKTGLTASYTYDAFNRRVSKTVNGTTTYFLHDENEDIAEYSSTGTLQAQYVYGPGLDEVLTMERSGQKYYYHHDALGSVTEITDNTGTVLEKYLYDVYGSPVIKNASGTILSTSAITNPHMFTGRRLDSETGLFYYRNRMYSPTLGRFLQRDPIGYWDNMNLYGYVGNNPINWLDPYGLLKASGGWPVYSPQDYQNGKNKIKEEIKKKYPWMPGEQAEKMADDIMREMTLGEAGKMKDYEKEGNQQGAEDLVKKICERTGNNCAPEEPKEDKACEPQQK